METAREYPERGLQYAKRKELLELINLRNRVHAQRDEITRLQTAYLEKVAALDSLKARVESLKTDLKDCRNELCLRCGQYKTAHLGACEGCRWKR